MTEAQTPPTTVSRRSVLIGAAAAAVGLGVWSTFSGGHRSSRAGRGVIIGPGRFINTDTGKMSFVLCLFDLDNAPDSHGDPYRTIEMDFFGHGFAEDPRRPGRAVIFEKKGAGCCEVDLREGKVTRPITTTADRAFYGHGAFSRDGQVLFATENRLDTKDGLVCIRDAETLREIGQFPTYGKSPHDCHLVDEGRTLVITNGGGPLEMTTAEGAPCVSFVDVRSTKLLERLVFETPQINAGHLALSGRNDLVTVSAPRDGLPTTARGGVTLRSGKGRFVTMTTPPEVTSRMVGESLSLCIDEASSVVGVTNPDGNIVTFWDIPGQRFVKKLDLPAPRGLTKTLNEEYLVLSYGAGTLALIAPGRLELMPLRGMEKSVLSGSHIVAWDSKRRPDATGPAAST